ncbi:hypothetical protein GFL93_31425 [Rhizobium leguminosarum bv. viciae]|uniref:Uncharacterized protein n=1 Tax=Rhizobium leguminosarum bv. viciae TaxID=387 RepID=A0A8G2MP52_RHILV|nr:hypothetical protein [Rhizobium leguminosarum bv. viciae]NKK23251.1 hypothetical protein [Rhizobium leguminosarum bv. viciae]TBX84305.1 hypothetical protein E0H31_37000 [Rhizobium leguminosarum bv. viciae]TBZ13472.1 hypothetical protein E0H52_26460 [Rhizobium leguminosarum bv. viciae]
MTREKHVLQTNSQWVIEQRRGAQTTSAREIALDAGRREPDQILKYASVPNRTACAAYLRSSVGQHAGESVPGILPHRIATRDN